jgi:hypothetical protein
MTSSETPTDDVPADGPGEGAVAGAEGSAAVDGEPAEPSSDAADAAAPDEPEPAAAVPVEPAAPTAQARPAGGAPFPPWILAAAVIPPGWFFVLRTVRWHLTPSAVMLMICWVAIVTIGYFVIRMALAATSPDDAAWFTSRGEREELEREKRSLLKAIKEIEFDRETGKLSAADAATLTATYRARAIEVIKAIEAASGSELTAREQILAEVRARRAVEAKVKQAKHKKKGKS